MLDSIEANLVIWLDASNIDLESNATISDGDMVASWMDLSGNYLFTQTDAAYQPKISFNSINSLPTLSFTGSEYVSNASPKTMHDFISNGNESTVFIVHDLQGETTVSQRLFSNNVNGDRSFEILLPHNSGNAEMWWGSSGTYRHDLVGTTTVIPYSEPFMYSARRYDAISDLYINGTGKQTSESLGVDLADNVITETFIGVAMDEVSFYDGEIAEIIVFNSVLTDEQFFKVQYYLSKKWGLGSDVDSDGDGFIDEIEESLGSSPMDPTDIPSNDLSDIVDTEISIESRLDSVESVLKLWLDASNSDFAYNTTLSDGDSISNWSDLSGSGANATSVSNSYDPSLATNVYGDGLDIIDFENAYLDIDLESHQSQGFTMFVVYDRQNNYNGGWDSLIHNYDTTYAHSFWLMDNYNGSTTTSGYYDGDAWNQFESGNSSELNLMIVRMNSSGGSLYMNGDTFLDNNSSFTIPLDSNGYTIQPTAGTRLGRAAHNTSSHDTDVHIAEILIFYDELSDKRCIHYHITLRLNGS